MRRNSFNRWLAVVFLISALSVYARTNRCLEFDGPETAAEIQRLTGLKTLNDSGTFTFEAWIRPRTQGGGGRGRLLEQSGGALTWYLSDNGKMGFRAGKGSSWMLSDANVIHYWDWQHVAISGDGSAVRFFVNGKPCGEFKSSAPIELGNGSIVIGNGLGEMSERRWYDGWIDDLLISSTCRYTESFSPPLRDSFRADSTTVCYFHFDEGLEYSRCLDYSTYNSEVHTGDAVLGSQKSPKRTEP